MISGLDHIALAVRDLPAAIDGYTRLLGVAPNWVGGDGGARHAWFQLPNMALDVIAPHGEGAFGDTSRAHLDAHGEGIWAIAFTTPDIDAAQTLLARRGIAGSPPRSTRSTHDDGRKRYWTTSTLDAAATGGEYYRAEDAERLTQVLLDLPRDVTLQTRQEEVTAWFVAGGALLVLGGVGLSVWLNRPRRAVSAI